MTIQFSDFLASLALIVSIGSIWFQDRGVRKQLMVSNISEYTRRYQEIIEKLPNNVLDENFKLDAVYKENKENKETLLRLMWLYFDLCYEEYMLYYELNIIDKNLWNIWEISMKSAFGRPAFYECWKEVSQKSFYPKNFSKFVNDNMIELHERGRRTYSNPK